MTSTRTEVPSGWAKSRFTELAVRRSGVKIPKASKSIYQTNGKFPVVDQGQDMVTGFVDDDELQFPGQLPVIVFGDHTRIFKYVDFPFVPGADGTQIITPRPDRVDASFLYYALCNLPLTNLGYSRHFKLLKEQTVCFPESLCEQRKIAAILSSVDDAIEKTQAVIDQVQVVKRGLMQELLTRGLPGRHTRFKQTEIGEIPEEWRTVSLAECGAGVTSGSRGWAKYYSDDGALFLRITNLARGSIRLQLGDTKHVTLPQRSAEAIRTRVQPRDLVISITADLGMVGVIPEDIGEAYVNQHVALVRFCSHEMRSEFAGYFLTTDVARNRFQRLNDSGAKAGLNLATIKNMTVPQPPCAEQDLIVKILSTMEDRLAGEVRTLDGLAAAKSALMSVLLTGELRVTPDPEVA